MLEKDIRLGQLNKYLPLNPLMRSLLERRLLPDPKQAEKFEAILRAFRFHEKSSGEWLI